MLINLSNHPLKDWEDYQIKTAIALYGNCIDLNFPQVDPLEDCEYINNLAVKYYQKLKAMKPQDEVLNVHIMGEMTFVFRLVTILKENGIMCIASTTERDTLDTNKGQKVVNFKFIRFREY